MHGPVAKTLSPDEEHAIVKRAQAGDKQAMSLLYNQYVTLVYRYVYLRVGNQQEAEDITQDVFIKVFDGLAGFEFRSSFKTWLFTIIRARIIDLWRKKYKEVTVPLEDFLAHAPVFETDETVEVEREAEIHDAEEGVRSALGQLPENYRAILELRFLKGYTLKEAADELGISVNNAKVRQFRAIQRARKLAGAEPATGTESTERLENDDEE